MGAEIPVTLCNLGILVDEPAESVPAQNSDVHAQGSWMRAPGRRPLLQCPVRPVRVVVIDVLTEDQPQVPFAGYQPRSRHSRRALAIQRSAIAFARGAWTGDLMIRIPAAASTASKAAVNLVSRSRIRNFLRHEVARCE